MASVLGIDLNSLWWGTCQSLLEIVDTVGDCFDFLVGKADVSAEANGGQGGDINNLLVDLFKGSDGGYTFTNMYTGIFLGSIVFFGMLIVIGAIKAQFSKEPGASLSQIGFKGFFAFLKILIIPAVFFVALQATGVIFNFLIEIMSGGAATEKLADALCKACAPAKSQISFTQDFDTMVDNVGGNSDNFSYMLCILSSCFLLVTLVTVCISLVKRIIEVFFYYLAAPIAIARTPIDDGKSYEQWKDNVIAKLLSAGGIIICMYLYYALIGKFTAAVDGWTAGSAAIKDMLKILFIIGGSMVPASASMLMAQLISQGAGQNEANNMMHTQQMMGNALRTAGLVGGKVLGSALTASGGTAKGIASRLFGGSSSGAVASALSNETQKTPTLNSGGGGAAAALTAATTGGTGVGRAASHTSEQTEKQRASGISVTGGAWRNSAAAARDNLASQWNNPAKQGFFQKFGMLSGAAGTFLLGGMAGTAAGAVKGVSNFFGKKRDAKKNAATNTKEARHDRHNQEEAARGEAMLAQFGATQQQERAAEKQKWGSYDRAVTMDQQSAVSGHKNLNQYMTDKMDALEARQQEQVSRLDAFDRRPDAARKLTDGERQSFMRDQMGDQYTRYGEYLQHARESGHLSEDQLRSHEERFRRIGATMGIKPTAPKKGGDKK